MPCRDKVDQICIELGEDVDSEVCQELNKHLQECPDCRAYVDSLKKTVYLYRSLPGNLPSEKAREVLIKKLNLG